MNYLDITLGLLLLIGAIRGFLKGFIFEIAVIGALFLGTYCAFKFSHLLIPYLSKWDWVSVTTSGYLSAFIIFTLVALGIFLLARLFEGLVKITALGVFNKVLGAVFGLLKVAFITSLLLYFYNKVDPGSKLISADKKAESVLYYKVLNLAPVVLPAMKELKELIQQSESEKGKMDSKPAN